MIVEIVLAVSIALAIAVLLVLLLILYCWDRSRRNKKLGKLLKILGAPTERRGEEDELDMYGNHEAWRESQVESKKAFTLYQL